MSKPSKSNSVNLSLAQAEQINQREYTIIARYLTRAIYWSSEKDLKIPFDDAMAARIVARVDPRQDSALPFDRLSVDTHTLKLLAEYSVIVSNELRFEYDCTVKAKRELESGFDPEDGFDGSTS